MSAISDIRIDMPPDIDCAICLDTVDEPLIRVSHRTNRIYHSFHRTCVSSWIFRDPPRKDCPLCRQPMKAIHITQNNQERVIQIPHDLELPTCPRWIGSTLCGITCCALSVIGTGYVLSSIFSLIGDLANSNIYVPVVPGP